MDDSGTKPPATMDIEVYARAAYAAYMKHSLREPVPWSDLPQVERDAWARIALGVLEVGDQP